MSNSWDHTVRAMSADEVVADDQLRARANEGGTSSHGDRECSRCSRLCAVRGCREHPRYVTGYSYVTGRRGRVGRSERSLCGDHAQRYATQHGLHMPPSERRVPA